MRTEGEGFPRPEGLERGPQENVGRAGNAKRKQAWVPNWADVWAGRRVSPRPWGGVADWGASQPRAKWATGPGKGDLRTGEWNSWTRGILGILGTYILAS